MSDWSSTCVGMASLQKIALPWSYLRLAPPFPSKKSGIRQVGFVPPPTLPLYRGRDHYSTQHYSAPHCITLHCARFTTPHHNYNCNYATLITLHYTTATTSLHYNYNYSCTTPHYIQQLCVRWPLQPVQPLQKTQLQPPFGPSVDSLCHPCITATHLSYSVLSLKLPPPPCAVLMVFHVFSKRRTGCFKAWGFVPKFWTNAKSSRTLFQLTGRVKQESTCDLSRTSL